MTNTVIYRRTIAVTGATGGAGVATATLDSPVPIRGEIIAIHLEYIGTPPATTDVTIVGGNASPVVPILTVTNANTDGWFYPRAIPVSIANAAITDAHVPIYVADIVNATIAQANDADGVTVTILWRS